MIRIREHKEIFFISLFNFVLFAILVNQKHHYFLQDDNWAQFGPVLMSAGEFFFRHWQLPAWLPWTALGVPALEVGTYALLYPGTYIAYAVARWGWGDATYTIDVFCWMHLFAATFVAYRVFLKFVRDPWTAVFASLAFCYCGYFLIAGRSWYYMTPVALYLPALFYYFGDDPRGLSLRRQWICALTVALFFLSGNAQMWVYSCLFFAVAAGTYAYKKYAWGRAEIAIFLGRTAGRVLLLAGPQLYLQAKYIRGVDRYIDGSGYAKGLVNFIVPGFLSSAEHPNGWGDSTYMGAFYFGGGVFFVLALWATVRLFLWLDTGSRANRPAIDRLALIILCPVFAFIFLWGFGDSALPNYFFSRIPPFKLFSGLYKLIPFVHFFAILIAGIAFSEFFTARRWYKPWVLAALIASVGANAWYCQTAFYNYTEEVYRTDSPAVQLLRADVRYANNAPDRLQIPAYSELLPNNVAVLAHRIVFNGYEPFVTANPNTVFGLVNKGALPPEVAMLAYGSGELIAYEDSKAVRVPLPGATPLAFCEASHKALAVTVDWNQLQIKGAHACDREPIIATWTYWPYWRTGNLYALDQDKFFRLRITPPAALATADVVNVRYELPLVGLYSAFFAIFILCELIGGWSARRLQKSHRQ